MLSTYTAISWLIGFSVVFALAGVLYARKHNESLEDFIVARNSQGSVATILTLLASSLGVWILFSPAQAATWGGLAAITGYAIGSMSPRLAMIPLGQRMRELVPQGHTLTEFVMYRYGKGMYGLTLAIVMFYMFIALTAEITAISKLLTIIAPIPLWLTASIVLIATLIYTAYGGLRASIFTDKVQMLVILPLLLFLVYFGWQLIGSKEAWLHLRTTTPQLLNINNMVGIKAGVTFFVAILLTGIFHQGNWQRIYAAKNTKAMRRGFLLGGLFVAPFIFVMGMFGLAFMANSPDGDSSVALFSVLMPGLPAWFVIALIPLGLALVMSSADTVISAFSSMIIIDAQRLSPSLNREQLMRLSNWAVVLLAVPVIIAAAQGYSVLYLFLLADLLCAAAAFPVFYGLYSRRHLGTNATISTIAGLAAGLYMFPAPDGNMNLLLESFLLAALVPALCSLMLERIIPDKSLFNLESLKENIKGIDQQTA